jgi:glycosyltransferase involved in cell wall biosynthesis
MSRVSVIIPTHNRPKLLAAAIESARMAGREVEIIVVDDASVDETAHICRETQGIKYVRLEHRQGVAGARNLGLLASTSEYVSFLDDDDLRLPGSLDYQSALLESEPRAGFVCGPVLMSDQMRQLTGESEGQPPIQNSDAFWELLSFCFPALPSSVVVRRECFFRVGLFNTHLSGIDDWDMWVRIAELFPVLTVSQPVSIYRKPTPASGQGSSELAKHYAQAARHQLSLLRLPRALVAPAPQRRSARRTALNRISDQLIYTALARLREGAYVYAARNILTGFRLNPLWPFRFKVCKFLSARLWRLAKNQANKQYANLP